MKKSGPPALATWMLEHLMLGGRNEALAGDLLEEFAQRRSVAWYWRQVLGAIFVSLSNELHSDWAMVWTIVFTVVWAYALYVMPFFDFPPSAWIGTHIAKLLIAHGYYGKAIWFALPIVTRFALPILFLVAAPLGIYRAGARNLNLRPFTLGLCAGALALYALQTFSLQPVLDYLVLHGLANYWTELWKWYTVLRKVVPLLIAIWVAQASKKGQSSTAIPT